jgi:hypothetical protein
MSYRHALKISPSALGLLSSISPTQIILIMHHQKLDPMDQFKFELEKAQFKIEQISLENQRQQQLLQDETNRTTFQIECERKQLDFEKKEFQLQKQC